LSTEAAMPKAAPWVEAVGRVCYRFRRQFQLVLLLVCLMVARPVPARTQETILLACSILLVLVGGSLRSWAMGYHTWRRMKGDASRRRLVTAGPYAHTRNPLYLGSLLIGCGIAAMSGWLIILLAFAVLFIVTHYCIIRWEEGRLDEEFLDAYRRYATEVPRLFPGLRSARKRAGTFDFPTMIRCMEPVKTIGFIAALLLMDFLASRGWTLGA